MRDASTLVTSAEAAALITEITGRSCVPENVRRLARSGQLQIAAVVGNGRQRLFDRSVVEEFAAGRRDRGETR
jgi:hypothetical protein